jgi:ATP-dependent exoDNAse (exonuclease V) alpha subunit
LRPEITNDGKQIFVKDPKTPSKFAMYDLIIIDEASMIDDALFAEIMAQNIRNSKIIFVGDPEQIPPVGPTEKVYLKPLNELKILLTTAFKQFEVVNRNIVLIISSILMFR